MRYSPPPTTYNPTRAAEFGSNNDPSRTSLRLVSARLWRVYDIITRSSMPAAAVDVIRPVRKLRPAMFLAAACALQDGPIFPQLNSHASHFQWVTLSRRTGWPLCIQGRAWLEHRQR